MAMRTTAQCAALQFGGESARQSGAYRAPERGHVPPSTIKELLEPQAGADRSRFRTTQQGRTAQFMPHPQSSRATEPPFRSHEHKNSSTVFAHLAAKKGTKGPEPPAPQPLNLQPPPTFYRSLRQYRTAPTKPQSRTAPAAGPPQPTTERVSPKQAWGERNKSSFKLG